MKEYLALISYGLTEISFKEIETFENDGLFARLPVIVSSLIGPLSVMISSVTCS